MSARRSEGQRTQLDAMLKSKRPRRRSPMLSNLASRGIDLARYEIMPPNNEYSTTRELVFANYTVAGAMASEIHLVSHSRLLSHRLSVRSSVRSGAPAIIDTPRNLHPEHVSHLRPVRLSITRSYILRAASRVSARAPARLKTRREKSPACAKPFFCHYYSGW